MVLSATAVLAVALTAGCAPEAGTGGEGWAGTVDTLPGGAVVITSPREGLWAPGEEWRLVEDARIGRVEGEGPDLLGWVADLAVDPAGRVWISEGQAREVRVFGPDGAWVRTLGGQGEGPGEFAEWPALRWGPNGRMWALDQRLRRFSLFDTAGTYVTSVPRRSGSSSTPWGGMVLADGTIADPAMRVEGGAFKHFLLRKDSLGEVLDTVDLPEGPQGWVVAIEGGTARYSIPYGPALVWRLDPHGGLWFGVSDSLRIVRSSIGGDTARIVRKPHEPVRVTEVELDSAMVRLEQFRARGGDAARSDLPLTKPAFRDFEVDPAGRLWVLPEAAADSLNGRLFDVFDPDGHYLGRVTSETRLSRPFAFGDGVLWATTRDGLDVPYVVRMRITGR